MTARPFLDFGARARQRPRVAPETTASATPRAGFKPASNRQSCVLDSICGGRLVSQVYRQGERKGLEISMSRLVFGWLIGFVADLRLAVGYALATLFTDIHFRLFPARRHAALRHVASALPCTPRREPRRLAR